MATSTKYLANYGKVYIAPRSSSGRTAGFTWLGDADSFEITGSNERLQFRESWSGLRTKAVDVITSSDFGFTMSLRNIDGDNLAKTYYGTAAAGAGASVTNEAISAYAGQVVPLKYPGVSSVVVTKTSGAVTLVANTDYVLDATFGTLRFLSSANITGTGAHPCTVNYTYAAYSTRLEAAVDEARDWVLRFEGKSLADQKAQVVEIHRANFNLAATLGLISTEVAALAVEGPILPAPEIVAAGESQFFRITQV